MTDPEDAGWERGWDGHERAQLLRLARLPLAQKIRWLEEAHRTVLTIERSRALRDRGEGPPAKTRTGP